MTFSVTFAKNSVQLCSEILFYKIKVKPLKFYFFRVKQEDGKIHTID